MGNREAVRQQVGHRFKVAHVQVLLHVVHDDAVVSSSATSVVPVVGVRTVVILPVPQVHSNRAR